MKTKTLNMTVGSPLKLIVVFALPLMMGNIFQQLYTVVDSAIIGQGVGLTALAALGTVDWLNWMLFSIASGFTQGISVKVSQKFGEGDLDALPHVMGQGARISLIVTVLISIFSVIFIPNILTLMQTPEHLLPIAALYSRILFGCFLVSVFNNFCAAMLRAVGDSKTPLYAMVISSIINILLDSLVVFIFKWGVAGAAGATVFAQLCAGVFCFSRLWKNEHLRFTFKDMAPDKELRNDLFRLSTPMALMNLIISVGGIIVQSIVNTFGVTFIAGYTATNRLYGLLEIAAVSYGYAITTYVGQNFGAARADRIKKGTCTAVHLAIVTAAGIGILAIIFGRFLTGLFLSSDDLEALAESKRVAYTFLCTMASTLPILYILYAYRASLQGMGYTVETMISGILEFFARVGLAAFVAYTRWENGLFWAEVAAWFVAAVLLAACYYVHRAKLDALFAEKAQTAE